MFNGTSFKNRNKLILRWSDCDTSPGYSLVRIIRTLHDDIEMLSSFHNAYFIYLLN